MATRPEHVVLYALKHKVDWLGKLHARDNVGRVRARVLHRVERQHEVVVQRPGLATAFPNVQVEEICTRQT